MAKTYVVKLEIDGVGSSVALINELENAVANLEARIQSADLGSNVVKLSSELKAAKIELKSFDDEVQSLNPAETAEKFIQLGTGIAGGFAAATGAAALLGMESETLEKTQVKVQAAIAIAVGLRSLAESKLSEAIGQSVIAEKARAAATGVSAFVTGAATKGVKLFRAALVSTGIGALVVAVGLLVAYWDDIKALVSGVTGEQKKLNEEAEQNVKTQEEALEAISAQENSLKLQGKTDREIRDLKIQQTDEIILATQLQLEQMEATKKAQVDAAKRNKDIAQGVIAFLTAPIVMLLDAVDTLTAGLAFVGLMDEGTNLAEGFTEGAANLIFDPEQIAADGDEAIEETKKQLTKLENARAGFVLQRQDEDNAAYEKRKALLDKELLEEKERIAEKAEALRLANLAYQEEVATDAEKLRILNQEIAVLLLEDEFKKAEKILEQQKENDLLAVEFATNRFELEWALEQKYDALSRELIKTKAESDKAIAQDVADAEKSIQDAKINNIAAGFKIISQLAGKSRAAQAISIVGENAVGIAQQIISTQVANKLVTAKLAALPGGAALAAKAVIQNNISLGIGIASSAAATAKALAALKQGGDTGGGASLGGGGGGLDLGTPEQTSSIDFGFLGDGDVSQLGETAPVQAYVLGADVSSTLEANQVIKDQSTL